MLNQTAAIEIVVPLLQLWEGFSQHAYEDNGGFSYGYGHRGCGENDQIDEIGAAKLLLNDVVNVSAMISKSLPDWLNPNQLAALISFTYNVGPGKIGSKDGFLVLKSGKPSTLLSKIVAATNPGVEELQDIGNQFLHWIYSKGEPVSGLCTRRTRERTLFLKPYSQEATCSNC